jgi:foldase protein PrsA
MQSRIWMIAAIVLFAVLIVYIIVFPPGRSDESATVAKVNGVAISKDSLYDALVAAGGTQTLESLISEELVKQESKKAGIEVTEADLTKEIDSIKKSYSSDEEFNQALASYNMTLDKLKEDMHIQVELRKLLEPQITITDEDIKKYYDENLESLKTPEKVRASHILVATKEEADTILADLKNGADFATVAKEKSTDPGSKDAGGDLDFFARGVMNEPFETAAFALNVGDLSAVVESPNGFHIIKSTDHTAEVTPTLEEKKADIRESMVTEQLYTLSSTWMQEKMSAASIETFLD